jgi:hypothetical protein
MQHGAKNDDENDSEEFPALNGLLHTAPPFLFKSAGSYLCKCTPAQQDLPSLLQGNPKRSVGRPLL